MDRKAFVLLSGGLDSTTCLFKAIYDYMPPDPGMNLMYGDSALWKEAFQTAFNPERADPKSPIILEIPWVEAISIDYGQRHTKEIEYAHATCERLGIRHTVLDLGKLLGGATVMLSKDSVGNVEVPDVSYGDIKGVSPTYVPFRNGLMLSALTAHAQKYVNEQVEKRTTWYQEYRVENPGQCDETRSPSELATSDAKDLCGIYFGAHSEDAQNWAYPDCTPEFIGAMANAIYVGSYHTIRLHTPLEWLMKHEIVKLGDTLGVPFADTWSCYKGEALHCGTCPTCRSRREAFKLADIPDPTKYATEEFAS